MNGYGYGISQGFNNLAHGIMQGKARMDYLKEKDKAEADEAKRTRAIAKLFKDDWGLGDSDIEGMDAPTLRGIMEGNMLKSSQMGRKLQQENEQLRQTIMKRGVEDQRVFNEAMQRAGAGAGDGRSEMVDGVADPMKLMLGGRRSEVGGPPPAEDFNAAPFMVQMGDGRSKLGGPGGQPRIDPQQVMRIAAASGVLTPEMALKMAEAEGDQGGGPVEFTEDPVSGQRFAKHRRQLLPSGFNPAAIMGQGGGLQRVPVLNQDGTETGEYMIRTPKGFVKGRAEKETAPSEAWLFADDAEEFKKGLMAVKDPKQRDLFIAARKSINQAMGREESFMDKIMKDMAGEGNRATTSVGAPAKGAKEAKDGKPKGFVYDPKTKKFEPVQ